MKKILIIVIILALTLTSSASAYTALDELDDRAETEMTAGVTWDEINEMAQNSPNSLTPIQGLMLWMFAILAFLKLAQKMDTLLQSLGLNVTQTGGRAVGDLLMAGIALKNVGAAISKGMSAFGHGNNSGGSPTSSSAGAHNPGGSGSSPISAGTPSAQPSDGTSVIGGNVASSNQTKNATTMGNMPTNTDTPKPADNIQGSDKPSDTRNPVQKVSGWLKEDGFAQGAIKASAKGGIIGAGIYTAKAGASKISEAISSHAGDAGISSANSGSYSQGSEAGVYGENPESYQSSSPSNAIDDQTPIQVSNNPEEYRDATSSASKSEYVSSYSDNWEYPYSENYNSEAGFGQASPPVESHGYSVDYPSAAGNTPHSVSHNGSASQHVNNEPQFYGGDFAAASTSAQHEPIGNGYQHEAGHSHSGFAKSNSLQQISPHTVPNYPQSVTSSDMQTHASGGVDTIQAPSAPKVEPVSNPSLAANPLSTQTVNITHPENPTIVQSGGNESARPTTKTKT